MSNDAWEKYKASIRRKMFAYGYRVQDDIKCCANCKFSGYDMDRILTCSRKDGHEQVLHIGICDFYKRGNSKVERCWWEGDDKGNSPRWDENE